MILNNNYAALLNIIWARVSLVKALKFMSSFTTNPQNVVSFIQTSTNVLAPPPFAPFASFVFPCPNATPAPISFNCSLAIVHYPLINFFPVVTTTTPTTLLVKPPNKKPQAGRWTSLIFFFVKQHRQHRQHWLHFKPHAPYRNSLQPARQSLP